jgi:two-component system, NarL family, nitrate/nitrite response regulator NarL
MGGGIIPTRIMIADGHAMNRAALRKLLEMEPQLEVVGEAVDGRDALAQVEKMQPDVLLLGLTMPQLSGWNVLRRLSKMPLKVRTILLPATIERDQAIEALRLGAKGVLLKTTARQLLYKSIRTVMAGEYWVDHSIVHELVQTLRSSADTASNAAQLTKYRLTRRELEVLTSVVDGCTNKDIADQFKISEQTVKHHLTRIFEKVGVSNRLELALFAMNQRLVSEV